MSQSFEKKVGSRLQHYEPAPPPELKKKVFAAVAPQRGLNGWQVTGLVFIIISLLFWFQGAMPGRSLAETTDLKDVERLQSSEQTASAERLTIEEEMLEESVVEPTSQKSRPFETKDVVSVQSAREDNEEEQMPPIQSDESKGAIPSVDFLSHLEGWIVFGREPEMVLFESETGEIDVEIQPLEMMWLSKTIKPPKKIMHMYLESGLFFIYQQAYPNLEDELVIESFEGEAGLSPKRIGVFLETGVHKTFWQKVRVHLGVKANTYQQVYRFGIRGFSADSITTSQSGDELIIRPIYDQDKIEVNHRLFSWGGRLSMNWMIFPSHTNELMTSIEYLSIVNSERSFLYEGETIGVGYTDQWLISLGMRKTLFENDKGLIQVNPSIRYSLRKLSPTEQQVLTMKPYSVGLSVSYIFGNFRERYKR
jgi:hypothetical protein